MKQTEKNAPRLTLRPGDFVAAALCPAAAAALLVYFALGRHGTAATVQVWQDGVLQAEYPLAVNREFVVGGAYHNTVCIENGRVCILDADCPGRTASRAAGSRNPAAASCLPNRLELRLVGGSGAPEVDGVTG